MIVACMSVREIKREVNRNQGLKSLYDLPLRFRCINQMMEEKIHVPFCLPLEAKKQQINATADQKNTLSQ